MSRLTHLRQVGSVAALAVVPLVAGAAAQGEAAVGQRAMGTWHLVFTSSRDGDEDVYAADPVVGRTAALTRNRVVDSNVQIPARGGWLAVEREAKLVLVSGDGRRERPLGPGLQPVFSLNGKMLAFAREHARTERLHLVVATVPGGRLRRLGLGNPFAFSPDGRRLAFATEASGIGIADVAGGRRWVVPRSSETEFVGWSPDGARLAFLRTDESDIGNPINMLFVVDARRSSAKPVEVARGELFRTRWLTKTRLGFERRAPTDRSDREIATVAATGGDPHIVVRGSVYLSAWSPRGDRVAYVRPVSDDENELAVAPANGSEGEAIARSYNFNVVWSPSGRRLAIRAEPRNDDPERLLVAGAAGRAAVMVAEREAFSLGDWAPDERRIVVGVDGGLAVVDVQRRQVRRVWTGPAAAHAARWVAGWLPRDAPRAAPAPRPELASPRQLRVRGPIYELAADGRWAAALVGLSRVDCDHRVAWTAGTRRIVRFRRPEPCDERFGYKFSLDLIGTQLRWQRYWCSGNQCYLAECSADARRPNREACSEGTDAPERTPPRPQPPTQTRRNVTLTVRSGVVRLRRASDGRTRTVRPPGRAVDAELENVGLYYAFNGRGAFPGRVVFVPFGELFP